MTSDQILLENICDTPLWDYQLSWNTTAPRLTSCLVETAFVWIPSAFFWICVPYLVFDIIRSNLNPIRWNAYNSTRLIVTAICVVVTFVDFLICLLREFTFDDSPSVAQLLSTAILFITRLALCIIFFCQRISGIHCSGIVWFYLLFDVFFGCLSVATYSLEDIRQSHEYILYLIQFSLTSVLFILCCFSDRLPPKSSTEKFEDQSRLCPKHMVSFPSKLTFWWITNLILKGWRSPLTTDDLWDVRPEDKCTNVFKSFNKYLKTTFDTNEEEKVVFELGNGDTAYKYKSIQNLDQNESKPKRTRLLATIGKAYWFYYLVPSALKLVADVVQLANPMIMKLLIGFTTNVDEPVWHGYFYAALLVLTNVFQSLINAYQSQRMCVLGMRIRTCLISAVYRKSLVLSNFAKKSTTTGEIVNLMAVDSQRFIDMLPWISFLYSAPVQVIIALYLLYNEMGVAVVGGLVLMLLMIPLNGFVSAKIKGFQTRQMKLKDERLRSLDEILSGIKVLKLYGWEEAFTNHVLKIREKELQLIRRGGYLNAITVILASCTPFFVALVTFAIYVLIDENNKLDAEKAFVSIALFNLLRIPLNMIPNMITTLVLTLVSVKRLEKFLNNSELTPYVSRHTDQKEVVKFENASFTWDRVEDVQNGTCKPTLEKINLKVLKGKFVAVVGSVGSGKSSLLSALLGDMEKCSGSVNISGDAEMAYVPQQAWIQNATLKDNILFGKDNDMIKYKKVIRACALKQDLLTLAGGDLTEIGEKGINLSGGQKQRVSLARAVYSDADLYLLDDPLSAVDSHVGKHILDEVLSSRTGLLHNKTRILVTNSLFALPEVDYIVVLKNGKVTDYGTYEDLMSQKGDFAELINQYTTNNVENDDSGSDSSIGFRHRASTTDAPTGPTDNSKLMEVEKTETGNVKLDVYKKFMRSMSMFWTLSIICGYAATNAANTGSSFWLSAWTEHSQDDNTGYWLGVYAAIGMSQAVFVGYAWCSIVKGTLLASKNLHERLLTRIMHAPMHFFDTTPLGRIVNRFSKDIDILDTIMQMTLRVLMSTFWQTMGILATISAQTPIFIAIFVPVIIIYWLIQKFYVTTSRQLKRLESITRSPIYSHFSETINGVSTIRAYGAKDRFIKVSDNRVDANQVCYYPSAIANCWLAVRLEFLANSIIFFAALLAVLSKGTLAGGQIGLSISYALNITLCLNWGVRTFADLENNVVAVERIDEYSQVESEADWHSSNPPALEWPQDGRVEFVEYGTRYRAGLDLVLKGVDIKVQKGEKIGIVGRTGAGKSSLTLALFRIIEAAFGRIVIDDIDISKIGLQELRSRLTIIPQDPVLFGGTIRSNLDPFERYKDEQIWTALEHSHLREFVKSNDAGIDYKVSEGGENLSVGQRQLMCLARALLRNTNILILDEATAAVDLETDALIQTTIRKEFSRCTVLTIAHRLNTIMDSDRVLVLDQGRVAEFDSPATLLNNESTIFYSLAKDAGLV